MKLDYVLKNLRDACDWAEKIGNQWDKNEPWEGEVEDLSEWTKEYGKKCGETLNSLSVKTGLEQKVRTVRNWMLDALKKKVEETKNKMQKLGYDPNDDALGMFSMDMQKLASFAAAISENWKNFIGSGERLIKDLEYEAENVNYVMNKLVEFEELWKKKGGMDIDKNNHLKLPVDGLTQGMEFLKPLIQAMTNHSEFGEAFASAGDGAVDTWIRSVLKYNIKIKLGEIQKKTRESKDKNEAKFEEEMQDGNKRQTFIDNTVEKIKTKLTP